MEVGRGVDVAALLCIFLSSLPVSLPRVCVRIIIEPILPFKPPRVRTANLLRHRPLVPPDWWD